MAERIIEGLHFPTSIAFDAEGRVHVAESGLPFDGAPPGGRVLRVDRPGGASVMGQDLRAPVTGLLFHAGAFYVSEGGNPGRISHLTPDGQRSSVVDGLPGLGNYHTNMAVIGPDGKLYFAQGAATNSGVVGLDAHDLGWLRRLPHNHDIPGIDVTLAGETFESVDPRAADPEATTRTGVFLPFGTPGEPGQRIAGRLPCTAAVMRCNHDVELGPFHRPIDVRVSPSGEHVYVLDFGEFELATGHVTARAGTGALWRASLGEL